MSNPEPRRGDQFELSPEASLRVIGENVPLLDDTRRLSVRSLVAGAVTLLWVAGVAFGMTSMLRFEKTPGATSDAPPAWPTGVPQSGEAGLPTLVVALHPRCSCSRASLHQLEEAAQGFGSSYNALLLIYEPKDAQAEGNGGGWQNDVLYREAQRALHAQVVSDVDGALAAKFGAQTSGEAMLYSASDQSGERRLLYAGGVTGGRGMDGANNGINALTRAFNQRRFAAGQPVFGCALTSFQRVAQVRKLSRGAASQGDNR